VVVLNAHGLKGSNKASAGLFEAILVCKWQRRLNLNLMQQGMLSSRFWLLLNWVERRIVGHGGVLKGFGLQRAMSVT
jgi:hypothetical protein